MTPRVDPGRRSRLASDSAPDLRLLFADLHNHSLNSDGRGDPELAFQQMREAGLDVAALTDHASIPHERLSTLGLHQYPDLAAVAIGRLAPRSIDDSSWKRTAELADAHDLPGEFTALRGFEWTEPWLGHVNVWFSDGFLPVTTPGRLSGLQDFLADEEPSALIGSSDEHGRSYGLAGKGRAGLWAPAHTRQGVREALASRRCYATREVGLRLDATLDGVPMGSRLGPAPGGGHCRERVELAVDCAGSGYDGHPVELQLITSSDQPVDDGGVRVVHRSSSTVGELAHVEVDLPGDAGWLVLRVADPGRPAGIAAPAGHPADCWAIAYASPWYL